MKLWDSVCNVRKRLDDYPAVGSDPVWTHDELELYLQDGYDAFCRQTKAVFDMFYPENVPQTGNHVAEWEEDYFASGMIRTGLLNFSGGDWEADYAEAGAIGPRNSTQPWEADYLEDGFVDQVFAVSLLDVPEDNVAVERATHNMVDLEPEYTAWFQEQDRDFQTTSGTPSRFAMDKDGLGRMRIVPAGGGDATTPEAVGTYGLLRDTSCMSANLRQGLIHRFSLDETSGTRLDSVGSLNLTEQGGSQTAVTGLLGKGANFTTSAKWLAAAAFAWVATMQKGTVAFWIKRTGDIADTAIIQNDSVFTGVGTSWGIMTGYGSHTYEVTLINPIGGTGVASSSDGVIALNAWVHCVVTFDGSAANDDRAKIYINGTDDTTVGGSFGSSLLTGSSTAFGLVSDVSADLVATNFVLDEIDIWNRVLSSDEIAEIYAYRYDTATVFGTRGTLREIAEHFQMGGQWGIPRRLYYDTANTRVEYFRLGKPLEEYPYELPERFAKYVEYYAAAKALERDGPGQDLALSAHFMTRFQEGVDRMTERLSENKRSRLSKIGSTGKGPTKPGLARLPWRYGRQIRRGY